MKREDTKNLNATSNMNKITGTGIRRMLKNIFEQDNKFKQEINNFSYQCVCKQIKLQLINMSKIEWITKNNIA